MLYRDHHIYIYLADSIEGLVCFTEFSGFWQGYVGVMWGSIAFSLGKLDCVYVKNPKP